MTSLHLHMIKLYMYRFFPNEVYQGSGVTLSRFPRFTAYTKVMFRVQGSGVTLSRFPQVYSTYKGYVQGPGLRCSFPRFTAHTKVMFWVQGSGVTLSRFPQVYSTYNGYVQGIELNFLD